MSSSIKIKLQQQHLTPTNDSEGGIFPLDISVRNLDHCQFARRFLGEDVNVIVSHVVAEYFDRIRNHIGAIPGGGPSPGVAREYHPTAIRLRDDGTMAIFL